MTKITTFVAVAAVVLSSQAHGQRLSPITSLTILPMPHDTTISVCGTVGAGVSAKGCFGTGGSTLGAAGGVGVTAGGSVTKGWDGSVTKCVEGGVGGGAGLYGTASLGFCQKNGQSYQKTSGGIGVGTPDGIGAAVYIQVSKMTPLGTGSGAGGGGGGGGAGGSARVWQPQTARLMCPTPATSHRR